MAADFAVVYAVVVASGIVCVDLGKVFLMGALHSVACHMKLLVAALHSPLSVGLSLLLVLRLVQQSYEPLPNVSADV